MKSLKEHEEEFQKQYNPSKQWMPTGIACPECGSELEYDTTILLLSNPPQRRVRCSNCNYVGSMH